MQSFCLNAILKYLNPAIIIEYEYWVFLKVKVVSPLNSSKFWSDLDFNWIKLDLSISWIQSRNCFLKRGISKVAKSGNLGNFSPRPLLGWRNHRIDCFNRYSNDGWQYAWNTDINALFSLSEFTSIYFLFLFLLHCLKDSHFVARFLPSWLLSSVSMTDFLCTNIDFFDTRFLSLLLQFYLLQHLLELEESAPQTLHTFLKLIYWLFFRFFLTIPLCNGTSWVLYRLAN